MPTLAKFVAPSAVERGTDAVKVFRRGLIGYVSLTWKMGWLDSSSFFHTGHDRLLDVISS